MRKRTKLIAVLSAVALLAAGAAMTSFADSGWKEENGTWVYLDRDGNRVTDTWKKSGNKYFYLDENGEMATNALIEYDGEFYYVDADGAKVIDKWVALPNDNDQWDEDVDTIYYRFGSNGKAYTDDKKIIDGKVYIFDEEGHMLSGWQTYGDDSDLYYLGTENEGWAYTGWQYLEPDEDDSDAYDDEEWFYFKPGNGIAYRNARKYINGHYYTFDENGVMSDKWVTGTPGAPDYIERFKVATISSAHYKEDIGNQEKGWVYVYAPDDPDEDKDQDWYYLDSKGVPFNEQGKGSYRDSEKGYSFAVKVSGSDWLMDSEVKETIEEARTTAKKIADEISQKEDNSQEQTDAIDAAKTIESEIDGIKADTAAKVIKSKTYLFDRNGKMLTGLYYLQGVQRTGSSSDLGIVPKNGGMVRTDAGEDDFLFEGAYYYFNTREGSTQGQMMTGKQTVTYDGDNYYYYFQKDGQAYTNIIADGALYGSNGARINAEDGNTYQLIDIPAYDDDGNPYWIGEKGNKHSNCQMIVNASGKVKKSGTVKIDGYKYTVKNYEVTDTKAVD